MFPKVSKDSFLVRGREAFDISKLVHIFQQMENAAAVSVASMKETRTTETRQET